MSSVASDTSRSQVMFGIQLPGQWLVVMHGVLSPYD